MAKPIDRALLQGLVENAQEIQGEYWDALRRIEEYVGCDIDDLGDSLDVDLILEAVEENATEDEDEKEAEDGQEVAP